jgi:acetyl-CoA carboxylase carboxyltransferase component
MASAQPATESRLERLGRELRELEARIREGGGAERIERQHAQGKLTARERIDLLLDPATRFLEIGLLLAYDQYDGQAPAAGVVTGIGTIHGRPVVVVANDATVKAGSWWPETITKMLRAQEIAMRCRVPIVYLVDSAGVNLPYQGGVFPGQYGASRIFYYNSLMRRYLQVPQIAAVMGPCIAGGAYLPALSDMILMVEGTSFMGLGGPNLVKGAIGQTVDSETLGGAWTHNALSGVAHYRVPDDRACVAKIRELIDELPYTPPAAISTAGPGPGHATGGHPSAGPASAGSPAADEVARERLTSILPADHRQPYEMREILAALVDDGDFDEFQADHAPELICGTARLDGITIGILANARGMLKNPRGGAPRFGGIFYTESAEKAAFFIDTMNRHGTPLLFIQDVSGFMVGTEAEHSGIIRAGARFVEAMATATVPKLVLTINHASGAGYYAMAGQGFDPDFIFTWPTGRMGVMEGESAIMALFGPQLEELKKQGREPDPGLQAKIDAVRADYEAQLDARYAAARGFVDAVILPEETRAVLALALRTALHNPGPHLGAFGVPSGIPGQGA